MELFWGLFGALVWIPIAIIIVIPFIIAARRWRKQLRESLSAKTDQAVYEGASADVLQLIHDLSDIVIQTKADKRDEDFEKYLEEVGGLLFFEGYMECLLSQRD